MRHDNIAEDVTDPVECLKLIKSSAERYKHAQTLAGYLYASHELTQANKFDLYHYLQTDRF